MFLLRTLNMPGIDRGVGAHDEPGAHQATVAGRDTFEDQVG